MLGHWTEGCGPSPGCSGVSGSPVMGKVGLYNRLNLGLKQINKLFGPGAIQEDEGSTGTSGVDFHVSIIAKETNGALLKTHLSNRPIGNICDPVNGKPAYQVDIVGG